MGAALFPAALMLASQFDLHNGSHQHRDVQQRNGNNCLGNVQGITAHHLCRGAQVQDVLRHQGGTMQVPRVIVDQRQHGKIRPETPVAMPQLPHRANTTSVRQNAVSALSGAYTGHCPAM